MQSETDEWRKKYKDTARELEEMEKRHEQHFAQLNQIITSMSIALQGQDPKLDQVLTLLGKQLSTNSYGSLRDISRHLEKCSRELDTQKVNLSRQIKLSLHEWLKQIKTLDVNKAESSTIVEISRELSIATEDMYSLGALLKQLIQLQAQVIVHKNAQSHAHTSSDDSSAIKQQLIELVQALRVPEQYSDASEELILRLKNSHEFYEVAQVIEALVELIRRVFPSVTDDFEDYLISLNSQLGYIQTFLYESRNEESHAVLQHQALDKTVRDDVSLIQQEVQKSTDINDLKQSVTLQLASIIKTMDTYRQSEETRESRLQHRYTRLLEKVKQMELETQDVKSRIEDERLKARTDPLTGLPNRIGYAEHLASEFERWNRYGTTFTLCIVDLDYFKRINDDYGHLAGDKVLRLVAKTLRSNLRTHDFISRFGGEEFIIIFHAATKDVACQVAEKLRKAIEKSPFNFQGKPVHVTASLGLSEVQKGDVADSVFSRADEMLYKAKSLGRNQVAVD